MRNADHLVQAFGDEDVHDIVRHGVHPERLEIEGLCCSSSPEQVGSDDAIPEWLEVSDLLVPVIGGRREAVHEEEGRLALGGRRPVVSVCEASSYNVFLVM